MSPLAFWASKEKSFGMKSSTSKSAHSQEEAPLSHVLPVGALSRATETTFDIAPDGAVREALAAFMRILTIDQLRMKGEIRPLGKEDWIVEGRLTAQVSQACVVSLAPVPQTVDEAIKRLYIPAEEVPEGTEIDLDLEDDEDADTFVDRIDLGHLMIEMLALALDPYPRAGDAALEQTQFAPPGIEPLTDESLKPFAKLAELKAKLSGESS